MCSCKKEIKPQGIANTVETDTVAQNLLYTNQLLVEQTNRDVALWVKHSGTNFALHEYGFWYRWLKRTEREELQPEQKVTLHYQVLLLDSTKCMDIIKDIRVGKKEVPNAIDHALRLMNEGEQMEIISPWYCAYGQKGEEYVQPYTNVRFIIELIDE